MCFLLPLPLCLTLLALHLSAYMPLCPKGAFRRPAPPCASRSQASRTASQLPASPAQETRRAPKTRSRRLSPSLSTVVGTLRALTRRNQFAPMFVVSLPCHIDHLCPRSSSPRATSSSLCELLCTHFSIYGFYKNFVEGSPSLTSASLRRFFFYYLEMQLYT